MSDDRSTKPARAHDLLNPARAQSPPVLLLVFNRPRHTVRLLDAVRAGRPRRLFIAADGPRRDHAVDVERCAQTRAVFDAIDWPCEVATLYRQTNVGINEAIVTAIDWFFENVDSGLVIEDDCIPAPGFFPFAGDLLERYRDEPRVMQVSGLNIRNTPRRLMPEISFKALSRVTVLSRASKS